MDRRNRFNAKTLEDKGDELVVVSASCHRRRGIRGNHGKTDSLLFAISKGFPKNPKKRLNFYSTS